MIKLDNLTKTYISKSKQRVDALSGINLEIGDSGLVFILGKSGSGKSTLLNILGGLDSATSGEIMVNGTNLSSFNQADFASYRNQYVGFVFQEFNLLSDFNVRDNVSLALQISKQENITDKVIDALKGVELDESYLTRRIDELSGGEKQRVAIARAIVKDSQMILADEPTGNLDSGTGESVFGILKNLSKTKLVIVVTHDRESASKYGDRIIEIADGKVIADTGKQGISNTCHNFLPTKQRLSNKVCFKMGANNLLQKKGKAISIVLLAIFTIFALILTQLTLTFSAEKSFTKFIKSNNIDYITLTQGKLRNGNDFYFNNILKQSTLDYIASNSNFIQSGVVTKKQDILDMGLSFIGEALEIDSTSYYLTSGGLEKAYYSRNSKVWVDGESIKLIKEQHSVEFLVGKKVDTGSFRSMEFTLAGVVDTSRCNNLVADIFPDYFAKENFPQRFTYELQNNNTPEVIMQFGETDYTGQFVCNRLLSSVVENGKIFTDKGLQEPDDVTLADDEIVLTYELYARLFSVSPKWSYVSVDLSEEISTPPHIGQSFRIKFTDYLSHELFVDIGNVKIAGVAFSLTSSQDPNDMLKFAASKSTSYKINNALDKNKFILVQVASINNLSKFLNDFRQKHEGYILEAGEDESIDYSSAIYNFEQHLYYFKIMFLAIALILLIILLLFVINLISFSIANRKKEIGILSALGTSNKDITKIFIIETLIISCITFVVNLALIIFAIILFNNLFSSGFFLSVPLLQVDIYSIITLVLSSFGLLLLFALIPLKRIIKIKPIDAIKNIN